jgi:NAD(P)-dependent dehydrogenase (short-subunit alcohol dehydrogenase family)
MGAQLCHRFAQNGLHIVVVGRTASKLEQVANNIVAGGGSATPIVADTTSELDVANLFEQASKIGDLSLALYNAGNNTPGRIDEMSVEYFEEAWRVCCLGGFIFAREALKYMKPKEQGAILFTGASASLRGRANFGAFNSSKSALRAFAQALSKEYGVNGIHVGHVVIDGAINGEKVLTRYPDIAEQLGQERLLQIESIVDAFEYLWKQPKSGWTFEVDVRTATEPW